MSVLYPFRLSNLTVPVYWISDLIFVLESQFLAWNEVRKTPWTKKVVRRTKMKKRIETIEDERKTKAYNERKNEWWLQRTTFYHCFRRLYLEGMKLFTLFITVLYAISRFLERRDYSSSWFLFLAHMAFRQFLFVTLTIKNPLVGFGTFYTPYRQLPLYLRCHVLLSTLLPLAEIQHYYLSWQKPSIQVKYFQYRLFLSNALQSI